MRVMIVLAAILLGAQEKKRGMSSEERALSEAIKLHYVSATPDPAPLKAVLEKTKGVAGVTFVPNENSVTVMFEGSLSSLKSLEAAGAASGVPVYVLSHAGIAMSLKKEKGSDLPGFIRDLDAMDGVRASFPREGGIDVICNLEAVTLDSLTTLAEKFKVKGEVTSHEMIDVMTTGDKYAELMKQLNTVKGLVVAKIDNQTGIAKCVGVKKAATDESIKKAVEKAGMKLNEVKRK
jgi:copper chaperone CopZ